MIDAANKRWRACVPAALSLGNAFAGLGVVWLVVTAMRRPDAGIADMRPAALMVFVAWIFDVVDGPAARRLGAVSRFGAALDSLADLVSFGVAPATLTFAAAWLAGDTSLATAMAVASLLYLAATAIRLARFTVHATSEDAGSDRASAAFGLPFFCGLSSAAAGMMVATVVLVVADLGQRVGISALAVSMVVLAAAMVSALPYVDLPKAWMRGALPWWPLAAPAIVGLAFGPGIGLLVVFAPYLASGPLVALMRRRKADHGS